MTQPKTSATVLSTKGQVILPKAIRDEKNWTPGVRLVAESTPEGVLLRPERLFPLTEPADVFGSLSHHGKHLSDEDIDKALRAAAKRRHARD